MGAPDWLVVSELDTNLCAPPWLWRFSCFSFYAMTSAACSWMLIFVCSLCVIPIC